MAKKARHLDVQHTKDLTPQRHRCPACGEPMWLDYTNHRTLVTLDGLTRLHLAIRRCHDVACPPPRRRRGASRCPVMSSASTSSPSSVRCATPNTAPCRRSISASSSAA